MPPVAIKTNYPLPFQILLSVSHIVLPSFPKPLAFNHEFQFVITQIRQELLNVRL